MQIQLINPRGFCAGVSRAIEMVKKALEVYGPPIYVKHSIVHNAYIIAELENKGVRFIEDIKEIPKGSYLLISAHGCSPEVKEEAEQRGLRVIDATCPLVTKIHSAVKRFSQKEYQIVIIGKKNHVEVLGIIGEAPKNCHVIYSIEEALSLSLDPQKPIFYVAQTTLNQDFVYTIVGALKERFPHAETLPTSSICYATKNRQNALKHALEDTDLVLVIGDRKSSNANSLVSIARDKNVVAYLISSPQEIDLKMLQGVDRVTITSAASTPEELLQQCIQKIAEYLPVKIKEIPGEKEGIVFNLPQFP